MALINTLRNRAGKILIGFVGVSMLSFIMADLFQQNSFLFGESNDVGEIGGNSISYQTFQQQIDKLSISFAANTGRNPLTEDMEMIRNQAWQQLLVENGFYPEYEELGIEVSTLELIDMVQGDNIHPLIEQSFTDPNTGVFNKENVIGFLRQVNSMPADQQQQWLNFEASLTPMRKMTKYENLLELSKYANKHEAKAEYNKSSSVTIEYLYIPYFAIPDSVVTVTEAEQKAFLSSKEEEYKREQTKDALYVVFDIAPSAADTAFAKQEIDQLRNGLQEAGSDSTYALINSDALTPFGTYKPNNMPAWLGEDFEILTEGYTSETQLVGSSYNFFKISSVIEGDESFVKASHILIQWSDESDAAKADAKTEATRILKEIKGGSEFADMARLYGTDGTSNRGGDLGWIGENASFDETFKKACFDFKGKGLLPSPIETSFGYHIIQITEEKTNTIYKVSTFEKELYPSDETLNEIYRQADFFASQTTSIEDFKAKAVELNIDVQTATKVNPNDKRLGGLANARTVVFWLFNEAKDGVVSEVFELDNQYAVAIQTSEQEAGVALLADVKNEVTKKVTDKKKAEYAIAKLAKLEGDYAAIDQAYGDGVRTGNGSLSLGSNSFPNVGFAPEAVGLAFSLNEGESTRPFETQNGVIMLTVVSKPALPEQENYDSYRQIASSNQRSFRRREEPYTFQNIYDALVEIVEITDERYKYY